MPSKRSISKAFFVLVAFAVAAGVFIAMVTPHLSGGFGEPSFGTIDASTQVLDGGTSFAGGSNYAVAGTSNPSPPSTVVLESATQTEASSTTGPTTQSTPTNGTGGASSGHSIEFFGNITLSVADPSSALQRAGSLATALGGYVAYSAYGASLATITVRVPSQDYQQAVMELETLGTVVSSTSSSDDVSVQYADLNATLQSLLTEQASLLKLLNASSSVNATLSIESVLQQTDAQINSVESSILQTSQLIQYATISMSIVQAQAANTPLSLKLSATPLSGMSPLSVTFNAIVKGGEPSYFVNYNFGDGTSAQGQQLIHQFTQPGRYNVTVSATDQAGNVTLAWIVVNVTSPPTASGLAAFGSSVLGLFARVVEAIIEAAVVVIPIGLVAYLAASPVYKRYSKNTNKEEDHADDEPEPSS